MSESSMNFGDHNQSPPNIGFQPFATNKLLRANSIGGASVAASEDHNPSLYLGGGAHAPSEADSDKMRKQLLHNLIKEFQKEA